jgi:hypothetical protein
VNVLVICTNILEGEEVTILGDGEFSHLKEIIQLIDCPLARILEKILKEGEKRLEGKILLHEANNPLGKSVMNHLTLVGDCSIYNLNIIAVDEVLDLPRKINLI